MSPSSTQALGAAKRLLVKAKLVAVASVAVVLVLANTQLVAEALCFWASALALAIAAVAFLVGIRQVIAMPRLEREVLEEQTLTTLRTHLESSRVPKHGGPG